MLKDRIAVIAAEAGDSWLAALQTAVNAHNSLDAKALLDNAPEDVEGDGEFRFRLRQENAAEVKSVPLSVLSSRRVCPVTLRCVLKALVASFSVPWAWPRGSG